MTACNFGEKIASYLPATDVNKTVTVDPSTKIVEGSKYDTVASVGDRLALKSEGEVSGGIITIHPSDSPYVPSKVSDPALEINLVNTSSGELVVDGAKISIGDNSADIPKVAIPAKGTLKLILTDDSNAGSNFPGATIEPIPTKIATDFEHKLDKDLVIEGLEGKTTKAAGLEISAFLYTPLVYSAGEKIVINRSFSDLGIDVTEFGITANSYQVSAEVTSTFPFDIDFAASVNKDASVSLKNPVAGGNIGAPKTSDVLATVDCSTDIYTLNSATLTLELTALSGARIRKGQELVINYKTVKLKKLF